MFDDLTPDAFLESANSFAVAALEAHHTGNHLRVAIDAGTALEHLAKACLAVRSRALLTELKSERNFESLVWLATASGNQPPPTLRTVSMRDALERAKKFVASDASQNDLRALIDIRDGSVHAAVNKELEDRLLVAFVQQADAFLDDLNHQSYPFFAADLHLPRPLFWGTQVAVVDALLADASNKLAHRVAVKLAEARASFERQYANRPPEVLELARRLSKPTGDEFEPQEGVTCPACASPAVVEGDYQIDWGETRDTDGAPLQDGSLWFGAARLLCRICGLCLRTTTEISTAGLNLEWELGEVSRDDYWSIEGDPEDG